MYIIIYKNMYSHVQVTRHMQKIMPGEPDQHFSHLSHYYCNVYTYSIKPLHYFLTYSMSSKTVTYVFMFSVIISIIK